MSTGRSRSESPHNGDPLADPSLEKPLSVLKALAGSQFEVLGPLGRDAEGEYAFLAREVSQNRLVVLKRQRPLPSEAPDAGTLQVITQLDSSVPPPAGSCPACQTPFSNWEPSCPECGANVAGSTNPAPGTSPEQVLDAIRQAAQGFEVYGTMQRAVGGAPVYFARDLSGGHLVALRLEDEVGTGQAGYTLTANRMMRPKLLYGTVAGESSRTPGAVPGGGAWTPVPSPPVARPAGSGYSGGSSERSLPVERICPQCGQTFGPELRLCPRDGSALRPVTAPDSLIGRIIADRYHIVDRLGQGGMGTVYLAEHIRMGRRCAVKVMNSNLLNDPDSLDRFTREAKNASQLNHPHVAGIYDFGETAEGIVYLSMEFVEGESLASVLNRKRAIPEHRALELGCQVADALSAAHELGIVHRDLKPDNIMICQSKSGQLLVKVVDFGIAKATQGSHQTVTRTGYVVGTPAYMSPEQILGDPLDGRSDLYSLGCILFEMLTGQRAFAGPSGEVSMRRRLTEPPPRLRSVKHALSKSLDEIVRKSMARSPEQRFQTAAEMREALRGVSSESPQRAKRRGWLRRGQAEAQATEGEDEPLVSRTPGSTPRASLLSPVPFPARVSPENMSTVQAEPDWSAAEPHVTHLRHRSARNEAPRAGRLVGTLAAVALIAAVAAYLVASGNLAKYRLLVGDFVRSIPSSSARKSSAPAIASSTEPVPLPSEDSGAQNGPVQQGIVGGAFLRFTKLTPLNARIKVDSADMRLGPDSLLKVAPGSHVVVVRASGYRKTTQRVSATAGDTTSLEIELVRSQAKTAPQAETPTDSTTAATASDTTAAAVVDSAIPAAPAEPSVADSATATAPADSSVADSSTAAAPAPTSVTDSASSPATVEPGATDSATPSTPSEPSATTDSVSSPQ